MVEVPYKFSLTEDPYLQGHAIHLPGERDSRTILSGATLLVAVNRTISRYRVTPFCLKDLLFVEPVDLSGDTVEVTIKLAPSGEKLQVSIVNSRTGGTAGEVLVARFCDEKPTDCCGESPTPGLHAVKSGMEVERGEFYEFMRSRGYSHSGEFQSVKRVQVDRFDFDTANGECMLERGSSLDAVIDGGWQAMVYSVLSEEEKGDEGILLPFFIGRASGRSKDLSNSPEAEVTAQFSINANTLRGAIIFIERLGDNSEILFEASDIVFRRKRQHTPVSLSVYMPAPFLKKIGIRSMACRLPGSLHSPDEFFQFLLEGGTTNSRIPSSRIATRNQLQKERIIEGGHFLTGVIQ